jgi:hypothetical protein
MSRAQLTSTVEQNSAGAAAPFVAGKNKIINGDFGIWQRGTSFTPTPGGGVIYTADRFNSYNNGSGSLTISQQALASGSIAGYEAPYFLQAAMPSVGTSTGWNIVQPIEDVHTLANQTVTLSFYAKATSGYTFTVTFGQKFGSGGSADAITNSSNITVGTSWARYSVTVTLPNIAGKTIGAGSNLNIVFNITAATNTLSFAGVQLEAGSVATPFTTATGTLQGELAACQRYCELITPKNDALPFAAANGSAFQGENVSFHVAKRVAA